MIRITITDRNAVRSSAIAANLLREIYLRHSKQFKWQRGAGIEELSGSRDLRDAVEHGGIERLLRRWQNESASFLRASAPYRLYPR
jgi:hypothetical protein